MKLATLTCLTSLLAIGFSGGIALAADEAGKTLDPDACKTLWSMASPDGKTISKDKAVDYVINFDMVNSDEDATLEADEFNEACSKGMIKPDAATAKDME
jgi:hypothetical protein